MPRRAGTPHALALRATVLAIALGATATLAGCGSASLAELPPAAGPDQAPLQRQAPTGSVMPLSREEAARASAPRRSATLRDGALRVTLDPRARTLELEDTLSGAVAATIPVGVGPTQVGCAAQGPCFVTDTTGDALLIVRVANDGRSMRLSRRAYLAGAPYAIAVDPKRRRLWITLTARNELVELGAHRRPHILRRHSTVRQPNGVTVDADSGDVSVIGISPPQRQRVPDPASPDRE